MLETGFSDWPSFTEEEAEAVRQVLLSNKVNYWSGEQCKLFEDAFADLAGTKYAISLANGTVALELAFKALGIGPGDEVIVTPRSFFASASSIVNMGAVPVFADVDRDSGNITAATVRPLISEKTRAIVCVHISGWPCEMEQIRKLADQHDLKVIEDCAQAHGATYHGRPVGGLGDIAAWSFCQDKIITTGGEGGMVTTNDPLLSEKVWSLKDHGKTRGAIQRESSRNGFRWVHDGFGSNARMTEMQAAIGRIQIRRLPEWHRLRNSNSERINRTASQYPGVFRVPEVPADMEHAWYKCHIYVQPECVGSGWSRDRIQTEIQQGGVPCLQGSCSEIYLEKAFSDNFPPRLNRLPIARELGDTSLMFLVHPTLTEAEIDLTCQVIADVAARVMRDLG